MGVPPPPAVHTVCKTIGEKRVKPRKNAGAGKCDVACSARRLQKGPKSSNYGNPVIQKVTVSVRCRRQSRFKTDIVKSDSHPESEKELCFIWADETWMWIKERSAHAQFLGANESVSTAPMQRRPVIQHKVVFLKVE